MFLVKGNRLRPHRLTVRTAGFQSANRSSILRGVTYLDNSLRFGVGSHI